MKSKWAIVVILLLSLLGLPALSPAQQAAEVTVESKTVDPGATTTVKVSVTGVPEPGLSDFQGKLTYDPAVLTVDEVKGLNGYTLFAFKIDNDKGEVRFVAAKVSGELIKAGDILEFVVRAVGSQGDSSTLDLTLETFNDPDGRDIPRTINDGTFSIAANRPPKAEFTFSPEAPKVNEEVQFTDQSTDPDGSITTWSWDFGDGATSTERNPTHKYTAKGKYTVKLTVTDNRGSSNTATKTVPVGIKSPIANFTFSPANPKVDKTVRFTDQSTDPDGRIQSWGWDFGDGTTSTERNPTHKYTTKGIYTVKLTVTDDDGLANTASKTVPVGVKPPIAKFSFAPARPRAGQTVKFTDRSTDSDGTIQSWGWDFGDRNSSTEKNPQHQYAEEGTYTVKLTITDNDGLTNTATEQITVAAGKPTVLVHCFPNPATTETTFAYDLPQGTAKATLYVFDITGKLVFHYDDLPVTTTEYTWDLKSDDVELPNGPYFYYIIAYDNDGKFIARSAIGKLVIQRS